MQLGVNRWCCICLADIPATSRADKLTCSAVCKKRLQRM